MSMNTLFKPVLSNNTQQTSLNNTTPNTTLTSNNSIPNQQQQPIQSTPTFDSIVSTQKNTLAAQKRNLRYVPPVFFAGGSLKRKDISFCSSEPEVTRSASISLSNNERRFSGAFVDLSDPHSNKNEIQNQTRIFSKPARPNHGLFGDGSIEKKRKIEKEYKLVKEGSKPIEPKASIEVSGYPQHDSEEFIQQHFSQYGTIKYKVSITKDTTIITFENFHAALSAVQKSNGYQHEGHKLRVKLQAEHMKTESNGWKEPPPFIRLETSDDLFKTSSSSKLGDGTTGFSALDKNSAPYGIDRPEEGGVVNKIKDTFLGW
ncbi:hypothetical protein K501DRAFT_334235 [Backusella circina FSU 941]|nr:hypothetical protein K501DRAFT_334235 [Backusella circina FSU 941]